MRIKSIEIDNFLSFRSKQVLEFPDLYNINFLIGLNGSGKSNLFKAIEFGNIVSKICSSSLLDNIRNAGSINYNPDNFFKYSSYKEIIKGLYKENANDNFLFTSNKKIEFSITYQLQHFDIDNISYHLINRLLNFLSVDKLKEETIEFVKKELSISFKKICSKKHIIKNTYEVFVENEKVIIDSTTTILDNEKFNKDEFLIELTNRPKLKNKNEDKLVYKNIDEYDDEEELDLDQRYEKYDHESAELIQLLNNYLFNQKLNISFFDLYELIVWKPNDKYNLQSSIDLSKFIKNPNEVSIPLNNICKLVSKLTQKDVDLFSLIKQLLNENKDHIELARIENTITKHINEKVNNYLCDVWQDFKNKDILIHTKIVNKMLYFYILNSHNKNNDLSIIVNESDGFKQMLSILLTLTSDLNNQAKLILIDEPEVHLHPSSIVALRKELFDIAYKNQILICTHSPFMVDRNNLDLYHELEWNKGESIIYSDLLKTRSKKLPKIIESCFGTDAVTNFRFSKINLLVEGKSDLDILDWVTKQDKNLSIRIQQGDGSHIPKYLENIYNNVSKNYFYKNTIILVDNDTGGKNITQEIKELDICKNKCPKIINYTDILKDEKVTRLETLYDLEKIKNKAIELKKELDSKNITEGVFKLELASIVEENDALKPGYKQKIIDYFKELQNNLE